MLEELADARLALGEHAAVAGELAGPVAEHPLRERLRALHLRALAGAGRQAEALAGFLDVGERLADELGVDPGPEIVAVHRALLAQDPALLSPPAVATTAPDPGELVGRDQEVAATVARLAAGRLVTVTGPGGVGKTRLARATATVAGTGLADGTCLVELAGLPPGAGAEEIAVLVARILGFRELAPGPVPALASLLGERALLLVLDNGEHVVDGLAELVAALLHDAPNVRVLVTSQEALAITGETVLALAPLALPAAGAPDEDVLASPAVRLFLARARAAGGDVDPGQAAIVGELCRRLDGLPLALELAAARVRGLGVQGVAAGTADRFGLLGRGRRDAPARQRTLRAAFDWARALLDDDERVLLRRLSVVRGPVDATTAAALSPDDDAGGVLDVLARLVERSWVVLTDGPDGPRHRLLESVAAYAAERHSATVAAARRGAVLADVLSHLGGPTHVRTALARAATRAAAAGDDWAVAVVDTAVATNALLTGELATAATLAEGARAVLDTRGERWGSARATGLTAQLAQIRGDLVVAERRFAAWTGWNRRLGADHGTALLASQLGFVAEERGDAALARHHHETALAAATRAGDPRARALALEGLAGAHALAGERSEGRSLLDRAATLRRALGAPLPDAERGDVDRIEARLSGLSAPR